MGACCAKNVQKFPIEMPKKWCPEVAGNPEFPVETVNVPTFWDLVQNFAAFPDYYCLVDVRSPGEYEKAHIALAEHVAAFEGQEERCAELIVLVYGSSPVSPPVKKFVQAVIPQAPASIFILGESFSKFNSRFQIIMHNKEGADSLPGPVEVISPTSKNVGVYVIHRAHFLRARLLISRAQCTVIYNISSRRLFVKTPGITLENVTFSEDPQPTEFASTQFLKHAMAKPKGAGKGNILVIDETGCDYGAVLSAVHLVKNLKISKADTQAAVELRLGFVDPYYMDLVDNWTN